MSHEPHFYYEYNHGQGRHILRKDEDDRRAPWCSYQCFCAHLVDALIWVLVLGFLGGAGYLCYYLLENYGDGGD